MDRGHTDLAYLNPLPHHPAFAERGEAIQKYVASQSGTITIIEGHVAEDPADASKVPLHTIRNLLTDAILDELVEQLLDSKPQPTGIFVPADLIAAMVQRCLVRRGIQVGESIEIISCNNEQSALAGLEPRPTTIDLRPDVIGRQAVEQLLWRIKHPFEPTVADIRVAPRLVE
jgi:DNA-binding LacI/PurR family transcriptional regulator